MTEQARKKIGIMGGTFDPIHYGHLMLAEQIRTSFDLDHVIFIPTGVAPHKQNKESASKLSRYTMVELATASNVYFKVSDIEINKQDVTYSIDTIRELKNGPYVNDELFFITGADAIVLLDTWKDYKSLVKYVTFVGATRPGVNTAFLDERLKQLKADCGAKIELCYIPALAISSTDIRRRVKEGKSIKYLLPEHVENYIIKEGLYR